MWSLMHGSLDRNRFITIVLLGAGMMCFNVLVPLNASASDLGDATTSIQGLEADLELLKQKSDSIDQRMANINTSTIFNSTEMNDSLFNWSNPLLWSVWLVLILAIVLLYVMRRSTMIVTIGTQAGSKRAHTIAEPVYGESTQPLAEPLKIVRIKVRKISKLNKSHAQKNRRFA